MRGGSVIVVWNMRWKPMMFEAILQKYFGEDKCFFSGTSAVNWCGEREKMLYSPRI